MTQRITIAFGDGIGPEIMESNLRILQAAGAKLDFDIIEVGKNIYEKGFNSGLMPSAWETLIRNKILLKAPITTPQGGGYKSLNVTIRKKLGLFANIRPVTSFTPFVVSNFSAIDLVIVRENEEDLYTGIEYQYTNNDFTALKTISRSGCEKIVRFAFEYAVANNRKRVSCFSKDNIMKLTDGLFSKIFREIASQYPQIAHDHYIIDIGTAKLANKPQSFDVIVTLNLYGDIISDVAAEVSGSVGLAGSANIGDNFAMFEAIHGSAPDIAGKNIANPSGLINATIMMLNHLKQYNTANLIANALYKTIEDGVHTPDIYNEQESKIEVGTTEFTNALIARLGRKPEKLKIANFQENSLSNNLQNQGSQNQDSFGRVTANQSAEANKISISNSGKLIGFDLFLNWQQDFISLINKIKLIENSIFEIKTISAKGLVLWPLLDDKTADTHRPGLVVLRFIGKGISGKNSSDIINTAIDIGQHNIIETLQQFTNEGFDFVKIENLYLFNGKAGYTSGQGE